MDCFFLEENRHMVGLELDSSSWEPMLKGKQVSVKMILRLNLQRCGIYRRFYSRNVLTRSMVSSGRVVTGVPVASAWW